MGPSGNLHPSTRHLSFREYLDREPEAEPAPTEDAPETEPVSFAEFARERSQEPVLSVEDDIPEL